MPMSGLVGSRRFFFRSPLFGRGGEQRPDGSGVDEWDGGAAKETQEGED